MLSDGRPHFAVGSALFGVFVTIDEQQIKLVSDLGFPGLELYVQGIWKMLLERGYSGRITLDLDPPRPNEGEGTCEDKLRINHRFLTDVLKVETL